MAKIKTTAYSLLLTLSIVALSACNMTPPPEKKETEEITAHYSEVFFDFTKDTPARQKKSNVIVTLEPIQIVNPKVLHRVYAEEQFSLIKVEGRGNYKVTYKPFLKQDNKIKFRLKITNKSNRVIRPSDAVLTFNIDGASVSVSGDEYQSFLNLIVAPKSTKEVIINGPKLSEVKAKNGMLAIDIYELKVGDTLVNFSWMLSYKKIDREIKLIEKTVAVNTTHRAINNLNGRVIDLEKEPEPFKNSKPAALSTSSILNSILQ